MIEGGAEDEAMGGEDAEAQKEDSILIRMMLSSQPLLLPASTMVSKKKKINGFL